ncbi:FKBP-type peptidyl-prolyl cis-trans isomerase [Flavobacterium seoulense]|uniref:Peptidyl-prolyl cis-trans isomerase n=1 Tax=Flavobacterium seoulense TaxID=1492738 RepID=A0A066WWC7_9FLAO|nr:FKBP-type peptidyl-prolyl cis-trans isomerase [Flavobacterium seoulense]KDN55264.1 peptidylprolyl isomerase [Flavobacterium seoulense]
MKHLLSALLIMTLFISCKKETSESSSVAPSEIPYITKNEKEIEDYVAKKGLKGTKSESGLYYVINNPGTGKQATPASNVTVAYKGYFMDGNVFDESDEKGISFGLNQVVKGWTEGISYLKEGGSAILVIPAKLGYGGSDNGKIPGGSVLVFEVKLISVN